MYVELPFDDLKVNPARKSRVAYFYDEDVGNYFYGTGHCMKPHRIRMTHSLIMNYQLHKKMEVYRAKPASLLEMTQFHTDEYIDFIDRVTPDNLHMFEREQAIFNVGDDCPVFDGLGEFCKISCGASLEGAARINRGLADVAINFAGGLHHAKKSEASGFCYTNDIVLAIIELLRYHPRVLYIDTDVHHGDGVEEAFYSNDRVMTCSFHKFGEFFPGTGNLGDVGVGKGKYYSVNVPLRDGIDDASYRSIFEPVIAKIMEWYQPSAVVLQCGGDSLSGDRLGPFNLSMRGHANNVSFVKSFGVPMMVLGGGGYTIRNVARTWAFETGICNDVLLSSELPYNGYYEYYAPTYELDVRSSNMNNANSPEYLDRLLTSIIANLDHTKHAPSVQMNDVPYDLDDLGDMNEDDSDAIDSKGGSVFSRDKIVEPGNEFYENDDKDFEERNISENQNGNSTLEKQNGGSASEQPKRLTGEVLPTEIQSISNAITQEEQMEIDSLNEEDKK